MADITPVQSTCPFCELHFRKLGNHLPHCKHRDGREYGHLLSQKTLAKRSKSRKQPCPRCNRLFLRLDTHLRCSRSCKIQASLSNEECNQPALSPQPHLSSHNRMQSGLTQATPKAVQLPSLKLPQSDEDWLESDRALAKFVVPAVVAAPTVDAKHEALCQGIYHHFSNQCGCATSYKPRRKRRHARRLKKLTIEKNDIRKQFRQAKASAGNSLLVQQLAQKFYRLVRLHSAEKKVLLKSQCRLEALKARRECSRAFWRYAAKVLDGEDENIVPDFDAHQAEQFFTKMYAARPQHFSRPDWLPSSPSPSVTFNTDEISTNEIMHVIQNTKSRSSASLLDGISYKIRKKCPSLVPALCHIYNLCWESASVPQAWKKAVVRLIPKSSASACPSDPANFRPIALKSCIGKVFTSILKNRFLSFMLQNGYMDTDIQKAFLSGIPGCAEHHCKLASVIKDATVKHRSLSVCWLDLANAYGSVPHGLIQFALQHYNTPLQFTNTVSSLYSGLSAAITAGSWATPFVPLQTGVYQGDPLSVVVFNTIMCTLIDALKPLKHLGYNLSGSKHLVHLLQYADDTCLVGDGPSSCQELLKQVERWLQWSGMKAKVPKCHSLAIRSSSGKPFDPCLTLHNQKIPFISNTPIKFLGYRIQVPMDNLLVKANIHTKLVSLLQKIDVVPVTAKQKLLLYRAGLCPRIMWDLTVSQLSLTWVTSTLEAEATRFLKKWVGLARSANPAPLYLPKTKGGMGLPSIGAIFKKQKVSQACQFISSRDPAVRYAATKLTITEQQKCRIKFKPMVVARDALAADPGMSKNKLSKVAKNMVREEDMEVKLSLMMASERRGEALRIAEGEAAAQWASALENLTPFHLKFALNACQDTLPHNSNLALWKGHPSECKLCGERQTLLHVLCNCPVALQLRRYNVRHDNVLHVIFNLLKEHLPAGQSVIADLQDQSPYTFPPHIARTDLRPDIVVWNDATRSVVLLELTVCHESNFVDAHQRKVNRYLDLEEEIGRSHFRVKTSPIQVGCRGFVDLESFENIRKIATCNLGVKKWKQFLQEISLVTIKASYNIWTSRNYRN